MPPKPKTLEEINNERELILKNALVLIVENGYVGLTMRDLAKLCNFSPTKIYYYFSNKEDIVMNIMQKGYQNLTELTFTALEKETTLKGRSECVCKELYNFGINYQEYFNLMFSFGVPHSTDFLKNDILEAKANYFKEIGLSYFDVFSQCHIDYAKSNNVTLNKFQIVAIFAQVIGVLKLYSSKITLELDIEVNLLFKASLEAIISGLEG